LWNGASGARLANQSKTFYDKVLARYAQHTGAALAPSARVLDYGCGWGRLTRYFARDVDPGNLHGCDPVQRILDVCTESRVPATFSHTPFVPHQLPYTEPFDLAYSFSVFTHISEQAGNACVRALHDALRPGGILVLTLRPPDYLHFSELMRPVLSGGEPNLAEPHYLFAAHPAEASHPQYAGGEMTYGESLITLAYVRERWGSMFELVDIDVLIGDLYQVMITLRRRE
ncbi:MAG: class I SAM-dependent methyltransferase, partial [Solirubrobacteraceae bacterium]